MLKKITSVLLVLFILALQPARSEELYGLAMHGEPKYGPEAIHLDYANPDAPKGGMLRHAALGTFDTLNPFSIKGKAAQGLNLVYDRLMARVWDEPFTMYPLIAEKIEVPEDRSGLTVHINPAARFHDGSPITANDVLFSFETLKEEGRPNMRRIYRLVETAEKTGDLTVKFTFGEGYDQETVMILAMMPVLSKTYWEGKTFDSTTLDPPLGNGPYKVAEIDPGRRVVYERAPDYWAAGLLPNKGHFNFDRIVYDYYRDDSVSFEAFKSGEFDLRREGDAGKWASAYDFPAMNDGKVIKEEIAHGRPERVRALIFNTRRPPFDDIRVRKALSNVLDFDWINENLFHGLYKQIDSTFPNTELAADLPPAQKKTTRQKLREAGALLKEAGMSVENGVRKIGGKPFTFEILLDSPEYEKIALSYTRALKRLGIDATVRYLDSAAYRARLNNYDYDMTLYYWNNSLSPGTEQYLYWSCEAADQPSRWNFAGVCTPEIDALAKSIAEAKTRGELVSRTRALDKKLMEGHYFIPLYYAGRDFVAYWKPLQRSDVTPVYGMVVETWWKEESDKQ